VLEQDFRRIRVELFGKDHGDTGVYALPHFHLRHHEGGRTRLVDANECVGREFALGIVWRLLRLVNGACGRVKGQQKATRRGTFDELTARR
jgi:hypothetical protein